MGLSDYKTYKKRKKFLSFIEEEFGITEVELKSIKEIIALAENYKALKQHADEEISMLKEQNKAFAEQNKQLTARIENLEKAQVKSKELTEKQKQEIKEKYDANKITTPEDIVKMFADDAEEFYPNGIGN